MSVYMYVYMQYITGNLFVPVTKSNSTYKLLGLEPKAIKLYLSLI